MIGKRYSKSARKSTKKLDILNTQGEVEYELEESDVTPFDCIKTPGKSSKAVPSHVMTRSQKKRKRKNTQQ